VGRAGEKMEGKGGREKERKKRKDLTDHRKTQK